MLSKEDIGVLLQSEEKAREERYSRQIVSLDDTENDLYGDNNSSQTAGDISFMDFWGQQDFTSWQSISGTAFSNKLPPVIRSLHDLIFNDWPEGLTVDEFLQSIDE